MGDLVVVDEVDVDRRDAIVDIAGDGEREPFPGPHRQRRSPEEPAPLRAPPRGPAGQADERAQELLAGQYRALDRNPAQDREAGGRPTQAGCARAREAGEAEEVMRSAPGEHAAIDAPALEDPASVPGLAGLHEGRVPGTREVDVRSSALVVVVEA